MAPEPVGRRVGAELTGGAFGVKRVVLSVGTMSATARRLLRKRLGSELDAVRDLIRKAEFFPGARPASEAAAAGPGEDGRRFTAGEPRPETPMEVDGTSEAKRRNASSLARRAEEPKRTTAEERERLAGRLASLAAALPDRVVTFLQNERAGDADYRGDGRETEKPGMGMHPMVKDGGLFQLKLLLDKFAPESTPKNIERGALDASGVSCLSQHRQESSGKTGVVEKVGDVGIRAGASRRIELRDIAEEYGELVGAIGVMLLSPLPSKYVDLTEHDEYVDICGDASPVVFPAAMAVETGGSLSSSSGGSGASSSDSDTSSSDSDSGSDSKENVGSPHPPPFSRNEDNTSEQAAQPPKPAPAKVQVAEPEENQHQCAAPSPTVRPITSSPPAPLVLPKENDIPVARLPESSAPEEAVQIAKPEKPQNQFAAPAPTVHPIVSRPSVPLALRNGNDTSAQPPESAPATDDDDPLPNLIAKAQEAIDRRRQEERDHAREKARQELLEVERAALSDERVHPLDMELLGIAAFEHIVSAVGGARTAGLRENDGRVPPGCPTVMQFLGLFLKADDDSEEEQEQRPGVAPGGADMDVEEGEIR